MGQHSRGIHIYILPCLERAETIIHPYLYSTVPPPDVFYRAPPPNDNAALTLLSCGADRYLRVWNVRKINK